ITIAIEQAENATMLDQFTVDPSRKYAVVFGNEVKGVQQEIVSSTDHVVEIPEFGTKHSLNISVSAGVVIWDLFSKLDRKSTRLKSSHVKISYAVFCLKKKKFHEYI